MKAEELTIEVKAKLTVDRKTAEGCLKMVELYVNETGAVIVAHKAENGEISFEIQGDRA